MKFSGICLITDDVPALTAFYRAVLRAEAQGDEYHAEFTFGENGLAIFSRAGMEEMAPNSTSGAGTGALTISFQVDGVDAIDAEYARLQALGVEIVKPPQSYPWGTRSVWFRDPEGNIVNFFAVI